MDDRKKKANLMHAQEVIGRALVEAMKQVAADTGANGVALDAHLQLDMAAGICAGGAGIALVYPAESETQKTDPEGAKRLVEDLLRRLKSSRGN